MKLVVNSIIRDKRNNWSFLSMIRFPLFICVCVILLIGASANSMSFNCSTNDRFGYECDVTFASFMSEHDPIYVVEGTHLPGFGDHDVMILSGSRWAWNSPVRFTAIPRALFEKFPNLQVTNLIAVEVERIDRSSFSSCNQMETINLISNLFTVIPNRAFENCRNLTGLSLNNNQIAALGDEAFFGLENVWRLDMDRNRLSEIGRDVLRPLRSLADIILRWNDIRNIHPEAFDTLTHLSAIHLSFNYLPTLNPRWFQNLNIFHLAFEGNHVEALSSEMFATLGGLFSLRLGENRIVELPGGCFSILNNLFDLELDHNAIRMIDDSAFEGLENLQVLRLDSNEISFLRPEPFNPLKNLAVLLLGSNRLTQIDMPFFKKFPLLRWLGLTSNPMGNFLKPEIFENFPNLISLSIANMSIEEIPPGTFVPLKNLTGIDLSFNQIRRLNSNSFGIHQHMDDLRMVSNGIDEIERNFFANFPNVRFLFSTSNLCIDKNFFEIFNINTIIPHFNECFNNWDNPRTTTGAGGLKAFVVTILLAFAVVSMM